MTKQEMLDVMQQHKGLIITYINETTDDGQILTRAIYPMALGMTKKGNLAVRGYQYFGASHTAPLGWRIFLLKNISQWEIKGDMPQTAPTGYNQNGDEDLAVIYQITYPLSNTITDAKGGEKSGDVTDTSAVIFPLAVWIKRWRDRRKKEKEEGK